MKTRLFTNSLVATFAAIAFVGAIQTADAGPCPTAECDVIGLINDLKIGDKAADGTTFAGNNFAATPTDAPGTYYTWKEGTEYCEDLVEGGHDDWTLPTNDQLDQLYQNKNTGSFAGTFDESGSDPFGGYWSGTTVPDTRDVARIQYLYDGFRIWVYKVGSVARVRCVRDVRP